MDETHDEPHVETQKISFTPPKTEAVTDREC